MESISSENLLENCSIRLLDDNVLFLYKAKGPSHNLLLRFLLTIYLLIMRNTLFVRKPTYKPLMITNISSKQVYYMKTHKKKGSIMVLILFWKSKMDCIK